MEQIALNWEPERRYFTVSELAEGARIVLGDHFTDIWVAGEISGTAAASCFFVFGINYPGRKTISS